MAKIVDCFTFCNELKMLKFRLEELYDTVDYFVLVEATLTHVGTKKELYFEKNKSKFSKYLDKIIHIVVDDLPNSKNTDTWDREIYQRFSIKKGIDKLNLQNKDIIMISDLDEIPDMRTITKTKNRLNNNMLYSLEQDLYFNNIETKSLYKWGRAKIMKYKKYKSLLKLNYTDFNKKTRLENNNYVPKGGWHFTYFGNSDFIYNKFKNNPDIHSKNIPERLKKRAERKRNYTKKEIEEDIKNFRQPGGHNKYKPFYLPVDKNDYLPKNYKLLI